MDNINFTTGDTEVLLENDTLINDVKVLKFITEYTLLYLEGFLPENRPSCLHFLVEEDNTYYSFYQEGFLIMEMHRRGNHNLAFTGYHANDFQMSFIKRRQVKAYRKYTALELLNI